MRPSHGSTQPAHRKCSRSTFFSFCLSSVQASTPPLRCWGPCPDLQRPLPPGKGLRLRATSKVFRVPCFERNHSLPEEDWCRQQKRQPTSLRQPTAHNHQLHAWLVWYCIKCIIEKRAVSLPVSISPALCWPLSDVDIVEVDIRSNPAVCDRRVSVL